MLISLKQIRIAMTPFPGVGLSDEGESRNDERSRQALREDFSFGIPLQTWKETAL